MILTKQLDPVKEIMRKMGTEKAWFRAKLVSDPEEGNV